MLGSKTIAILKHYLNFPVFKQPDKLGKFICLWDIGVLYCERLGDYFNFVRLQNNNNFKTSIGGGGLVKTVVKLSILKYNTVQLLIEHYSRLQHGLLHSVGGGIG